MVSSGAQSLTLTKMQVEGPDYKLVARHIYDKSYLKIVDFDDHFENVDNDWRNLSVFD